ncbi:MAG: hypothetical protein IT319_20690 [Anaerolineae bacterium]|nr:hypothetical protein [Anaerolineae bacterium]
MSALLVLPLVMAPIAYFAGRRLHPSLARALALVTLVVLWALFGLIAAGVMPASFSLGAVALRADALSLLFVGMTLALMLLVVIYSHSEMTGQGGEEKYYALLLILTGALTGVACTTDLFNLWLWFELMVVSTYFVVVFRHNEPPALEAVVKYLVQSMIGSVLVLLGIALVLAQTGTLALDRKLAGGTLDIAGALLLIGFGVKLALVPLHTWLPDAYSQAPDGGSALLAGVITEAGLIALLRALAPLPSFAGLLIGFGIVNMVVGNLLALRQHELKRLLAYSSLPHIGYMLFGVGIGLATGTPGGIQGGLFHLLNHGLMKGLAFLAGGALLYTLHRSQGIDRPLRIHDLSGAARRAPLAAFALTLALLSLAGIPPLAGFMSKWQIFIAGISAGSASLVALTVFAALNSVFSLAYYLPVVNALFRSPTVANAAAPPLPRTVQVPLVLLSAALILVGLPPNTLTQTASLSLLGLFG